MINCFVFNNIVFANVFLPQQIKTGFCLRIGGAIQISHISTPVGFSSHCSLEFATIRLRPVVLSDNCALSITKIKQCIAIAHITRGYISCYFQHVGFSVYSAKTKRYALFAYVHAFVVYFYMYFVRCIHIWCSWSPGHVFTKKDKAVKYQVHYRVIRVNTTRTRHITPAPHYRLFGIFQPNVREKKNNKHRKNDKHTRKIRKRFN